MEMATDSNAGTVRVTFSTNEPDLELREECRQLYVPAETKRYGLSRILNSEHMLNTPASIPLDFLINGELLRGSLADHVAAAGLKPDESPIDVVYIRALIPPKFDRSFEHPEWVAAVDVLSVTSPAARWWPGKFNPSSDNDDRILSGAFDGLLRMWAPDGTCLATSPSVAEDRYATFVKGARFLSPNRVASSGNDGKVRVWKYSEDATSGEIKGEFKQELILLGNSIETLEVQGDKGRILTGSTGGLVGFWSSSKESAPPASEPRAASGSVKRKKVTYDAPVRGHLWYKKKHEGIASVAFDAADPTVAYSGGAHDHLVRTLDLTTSETVSTISLTTGVTAITSLGGSIHPLVAAGTDGAAEGRRVELVDPREGGSARTSVLTLKGHANQISALAQGPSDDRTLASASRDGAVMVWDLRSTGSREAMGRLDKGPVLRPVYEIDRQILGGKKRPVAGEDIQLFGMVWDKKLGIISGGEDRRIEINRWE